MAKCLKCKNKNTSMTMAYINIESIEFKVWNKGYTDRDFFLCKKCLKKLYKFLGIKEKIKE